VPPIRNKNLEVLVRADGDSKIGLGHLARCGVLVNRLVKRGHSVTLLTMSSNTPREFVSSDAEIFIIADEDECLTKMRSIGERKPIDWLVVDHYSIDASWERKASKYVSRILVIDDLANRPHQCDFLLDQNIENSLQNRYKSLIPSKTKLLLGMDYLLARDSFYLEFSVKSESLFIFLGGGDHTKELITLIDLLKRGCVSLPLVIMITDNYRVDSSILSGLPNGSELCLSVSDPSKLMRKARCAIVRCGFVAYELALLGVPMVIIFETEVQREVASCFERAAHGIAFEESKLLDVTAVLNALEAAISVEPTPLRMGRSSGAMKVVDIMETYVDES